MHKTLLLLVLALSANGASAAIYKCTDAADAVAYRATPCADEKQEMVTASGATGNRSSGYNAACTHYDGRKVLGLLEIGNLSDAKRSLYIEWLYDEGPSREEKEACLARKHPAGDHSDISARQKAAEPHDQYVALNVYSLSRTIGRHIHECREVDPTLAEDAQFELARFMEDERALYATGRQAALSGISTGQADLSATDIEQGIRDKEQEISVRFASASPEDKLSGCERIADMLEYQRNPIDR